MSCYFMLLYIIRTTITAAKNLYYTNLFARHQNDLKTTLAIISKTLNKNKRSLIPEMLINKC